MNRRDSILALALAMVPGRGFAQPGDALRRIGFLGAGSAAAYAYRLEALKAGLRDFGYREGQNLSIDYRWADGDAERLPVLAGELVQRKVQILVTHAVAGAKAARQATSTIPIVLTDIADAVAAGVVGNLARPGGNLTGSTFQAPQLSVKRLELLKAALPKLARAALLINPTTSSAAVVYEETGNAARSMGVELLPFEARRAADFAPAFAAMAKSQAQAVLVQDHPLFTPQREALVSLAESHRLPLAGYTEFAESGGLIGYGVNFIELYRRAAYFIDRIFKGANPGDLPMEQPRTFELVLNEKTAAALGVTFPPSVMARAGKVIR